MIYQTIAEIYRGNDKVREKLKTTINDLTEEQLEFRLDENTWTIREIVEHISIVEGNIATLCSRLLQKAAENNLSNDGTAHISAEFLAKAGAADRRVQKLQAPERVFPSGKFSVAESMAKMGENAEVLRSLQTGLETINTEQHKFPHPAFGEMSATEWLMLIGGHERRHLDQIEEILSRQD
jgi:uncharacterized damage-inducible protein DinB